MGVLANSETTISVIWNGTRNEFNEWQKARFLIVGVGSYRQTKAEGYNIHVIMDRLDFLNFKHFCASKGAIQKVKTQLTEYKYFTWYIWQESVLQNISRTFTNHQQKDNSSFEMEKNLNRLISRQGIQMVDKHIKDVKHQQSWCKCKLVP